MENVELIHQKMIAVLRDIGAISKDRTNQQQGFKFRGIDQFMNECHVHFAKHGIFMTTHVEDCQREERMTKNGGNLIYTNLRVRFCFHAEDGSMVCSTMQGEGMDSADKSTNKAMAIALKYCLMQAFSVPTEEIQDPDGQTPPPSFQPPKAKSIQRPDGNWEVGNKIMQSNPGKPSEKALKLLSDIVKDRAWEGSEDAREIQAILDGMTAGTAKGGDISRGIDLASRYPYKPKQQQPAEDAPATEPMMREMNDLYKRIDLKLIPAAKRDKAALYDSTGWTVKNATAWIKYLRGIEEKGVA